MQVIAFTGMPGAGKSEAVKIAQERRIPVIRMGDFVWETVRSQGLPLTDENVGEWATRMRKERGADWWAQKTCDAIRERHSDARLIVIDGVRTLEEIKTFRERLGPAFHLVAVHASPEVRSDRLVARRRADDVHSADMTRKRDEREKSWGIDQAIETADLFIVNQGHLREFQSRVNEILDRFAGSHKRRAG